MSEKDTRTVVFHLDPKNPPAMTAEEIQALEKMPDDAIDYSDIPPLEDRQWATQRIISQGPQTVTVHLDADVAEFFSAAEKFESRINAVLREYVKTQRRAS